MRTPSLAHAGENPFALIHAAIARQALWITKPHILVPLAALTVLLLTLLWIAVLRRRIREKAETLRAVLESTEDGILAVDSGGRVVSYNRKFLEMWKIPEDLARSAAGDTLTGYVAGQLKDPAAFPVDVRQLFRVAEAKSHDIIESTDGRIFERHSEPQWVNGKCVGRVWGFRNVTGRQKAEQRLRSLSAAVEQSPISIVITDLDGNIEYANPKFTDVAGYALEEVLGRNPRVLKSGETSEEEYRELWETIKSGAVWRGTFHNKKKNGELYWESAAICAIRDASGVPARYVAVKEDITQRRLESEALQESERRYRGLFEHMLEGFSYCRMVLENGEAADFIYLAVNTAFETLTGLKDVVGKRATEVIPGIRESDHGLLEVYARVSQTGRPEKLETYVEAMQMWFSISLYSPERGAFVAIFDVITERKRAEASLHLTQSAVDQATFSVMWLDPAGKVMYANELASQELGYSGSQLLTMTIFDFDPNLSKDLWKAVWANLIASGSLLFEARRRNKNGHLFPVEVSAKYIEFGGKEFSCTFSRDITERKQVEDALRTSQERFRIAAETATDVVFEVDLKTGRIQVFGHRLEEHSPNSRFPETLNEWLQMVHVDDRYRLAAAIHLCRASHEPLREEYRFVQTDGAIFHRAVHAAVTFDPRTGRDKAIGSIRDITQQKAAEQSNAELATIVKVTDAAIIRNDNSGRILTWNSGAERMFGYSAQEICGHTNDALLPPDRADEWNAIQESLARGSDISHTETVRITKSGERIDIILTASPICDGAGNVAGAAFIAWNITERKCLERQLAQAQKLESIGQLAAGIAHEINTPIQYIGDNAKFLGDAFQDLFKLVGRLRKPAELPLGVERCPESPPEGLSEEVDVDYLQAEVPLAIAQLEEGVGHVARIVRAMKEFSHPGQVEKTSVDINRALESTIIVSRNEWKYVAEMKSDFDSALPPVPCVAGEMNQVFLNLIVNAAHAIADVVRDTGRKGAITVSTRRNGDWAEICVQDTGTGIPDAIRPRVFDPFFTTKEVGKGTGQGLSIAHAVVVQKHLGMIDFESSAGVGTTFLIRLPLG